MNEPIKPNDIVRICDAVPGHERHDPMIVWSLTTYADGSPAAANCRFVDGEGKCQERDISVRWLERINGESVIGFAAAVTAPPA